MFLYTDKKAVLIRKNQSNLLDKKAVQAREQIKRICFKKRILKKLTDFFIINSSNPSYSSCRRNKTVKFR